jgi:acetoin utilization deacetylase AcuC-like enzyme
MLKYELMPEQLIYEGTIKESQLFVPSVMTESEILSTHSSEYLEKLKSLSLSKGEERKTGFPLSDQLVERERIIMQGTLDASLKAIEMGAAMNIAGGTHHAYRDRGEGFCLLNDIALSANHLLNNSIKKQILVVDLDVHQGNGTASIFENENRVFTFSMHGEHNYPLHKERSDLDVGLPDGIEDLEYLKLLDFHLKNTLDRVQPDFIFYQCGVDILNTDKLGRLKISAAGCMERDRMVFEQAKKNHIPICCSMGGGYSEDIKVIVEAHCNTFRLASEIFF